MFFFKICNPIFFKFVYAVQLYKTYVHSLYNTYGRKCLLSLRNTNIVYNVTILLPSPNLLSLRPNTGICAIIRRVVIEPRHLSVSNLAGDQCYNTNQHF